MEKIVVLDLKLKFEIELDIVYKMIGSSCDCGVFMNFVFFIEFLFFWY